MNRNQWFVFCLLLLSVCIGVVAHQFTATSFAISIVAVLAVATTLVYYFMQKVTADNFVKNYILTIFLKLVAGGGFIFVLILLDRQASQANAVVFMSAYFLFTALEVGFLYQKFNN